MAMPFAATAMKRPNAAGSVLQALEPVANKLAEMEQRVLAGQATAVVQMGYQLADALSAVDEGGALGVVIGLAEERQRRTSDEQRKAIDALSGYVERHAHMLGHQQLFATVRMLSRMVQNLKTRAPRKSNQPG